ncbi:MAG: substrate-binding domain-containing protein [Chloroflexia bacterium]
MYENIIAEVVRRIGEGRLSPGDRLPPTRELAQTLGVNPGTVAHAYSLLEREGVLVARVGSGTYVAASARTASSYPAREVQLNSLVQRSVAEALALGYDLGQVRAAFDSTLLVERPSTSDYVVFRGSHDPALDLLWGIVARSASPSRVSTSHVGSLWGLMALERGEAELTGAHLLDPETGEYNLPWVQRVLPGRRLGLFTVAERTQGLIYRVEDEGVYTSLRDVAARGARFVNRQRGSGTRVLLDHKLKLAGLRPDDLRGYDDEVFTHTAAAASVAGGVGDATLGLYSSARSLGLKFTPIASERYDLVALAESFESERLASVVEAVRSPEFRSLLAALGGYETRLTGRMLVVET